MEGADGDRAQRYEVLETLLETRARVELRARDTILEREVLLVHRRSASAGQDVAGSADLREARALAGVDHPAVQRLHDAFPERGGLTLVLEPVVGESLATRLGEGERLDPDEVRRIGVQLADALAAVHASGAVHREVCARNVILRPGGGVCLTGFRFAKALAAAARTSLDYGGRAGGATDGELPPHPAPEQLEGEAARPRSDLFALGCVLYRALTGVDAQPGLLEHGWREPVDPCRLEPDVPRDLARLVRACLARSPLARPASAAELRDALGRPSSARRVHRPRTSRPALVLSAVLLVAFAIVALRTRPGEPADPTDPSAPRGRGLVLQPDPGASREGPHGPGFGRSHALLIAIGERYRDGGFPVLPNATRDVRALRESLAAAADERWETRLLLEDEATFDGIRSALAELEAALEPEDRALVYFAGHGLAHGRSETSGWLIPADAQSLERDPRRARWLHFDVFERFLRDAGAKHVLLAMDCCYGGRLTVTRSAAATGFEARFLTRQAKVILAAGRADELVLDGLAGGHSPFARAFLDALDERVGPLTSSMLHAAMLRSFAEQDVPHTPVLAFLPGSGPGEFVFLRR